MQTVTSQHSRSVCKTSATNERLISASPRAARHTRAFAGCTASRKLTTKPLNLASEHQRRSIQAHALPFFNKNADSKGAESSSKQPVPHFKLPLAIALAGAAFEAYLQPTGAEGMQEKTLNGAEVIYTDRCADVSTHVTNIHT